MCCASFIQLLYLDRKKNKKALLRHYEGSKFILNRQAVCFYLFFLRPSVSLETPCPLFLGADVPAALPKIPVKSQWFSSRLCGHAVENPPVVHSCSPPVITPNLACAILGFQTDARQMWSKWARTPSLTLGISALSVSAGGGKSACSALWLFAA